MEACVQLELETWGYDENDIVPRKTFLLAQKIGGQVLGAFDSDLAAGENLSRAKTLVGFAMSLPGIKATAKRAPALPTFAHAGRESLAPQSRPWRATQMGTTA